MADTIHPIRIYKMSLATLFTFTVLFYSWHAFLVFERTNLSMIKPLTTSFTLRKSSPNISATNAETPCDNVTYPGRYLRRDAMQSVGSVNATLIYSAYHDEQNPDSVKIVGVCYKNHTHYCQLWYTGGSGTTMTMNSTKASIYDTNASIRIYSCCFIICPLPDNRTPFAVSIVVNDQCMPADNLLEVTFIGKKEYTKNFTMCHSALHFNFSDVHELVQWIEFSRILGADNFIIYNFSSAQNIQPALQYYSNLGIVKVLRWSLPSIMKKGRIVPSIRLHYFAQTSAYNDCLLRSKADSKFVVITDMDEFLVPHKEGVLTWVDMLRYLPEAESYYFRHCYFPRIRGQSISDQVIAETAAKHHVSVLQNLKRHDNIFPFGPRNKYIARTSKVSNLRTHRPYGSRHHNVDVSLGFLHHYKGNIAKIHQKVSLVSDETVMKKYGRDLARRIETVWSYIKDLNNEPMHGISSHFS